MADPIDDLTPDQKRALLAKLLKEKSIRHAPAESTDFPLSAGQKGLWYAFRRTPDLAAYNVFLPLRVRSAIDLHAMESAVKALVARHAALRTLFGERDSDHQPYQRVVDELPPEFRVVETPGATTDQIVRMVQQETGRPFDLTQGPLLRVVAFRIADDNIVMAATTHHIAIDFWSLVLMMNEIRQLYAAFSTDRCPDLAPAISNYNRFVEWQTDLTRGARGEQIANYWERQLADVPATLDWVTDFHRPRQFSHRAAAESIAFPPEFGVRVKQLARRLNVTANAVLIAVQQVVIAKFSRQDVFSVGTPFSGRGLQQFENTVGFFVNLLPITADLSEDPRFEDLVRVVGRKMVEALANEALPFPEIVRRCAPGRDASRHPLFQVSCTIEKSHLPSEQGRAAFLLGDGQVFEDFAGLRQESLAIERPTCEHDMECVFEFDGDDLRGMLSYCRDLFAEETMLSLSKQFSAIAVRLVESPATPVKQVPWDLPVKETPGQEEMPSEETVSEVMKHATGPVIDTARRVASTLVTEGAAPGELIPICLPRGPEALIAVLGVMLSGAVPVPVDADQPCVSLSVLQQDQEIHRVFADPDSPWLIDFYGRTLDIGEAGRGCQVPLPQPSPDDTAYVIYTSGTTGQPKGVAIPHRGIAGSLRAHQKITPLNASDKLLLLLSHQFDAALEISLLTVSQNGTVVWPDRPREAPDLDQIIQLIIDKGVTILPAVGSLLQALMAHPRISECQSIRQTWTGGESVPLGLVPAVRDKLGCPLWNIYGPTEASVQVCLAEISKADPNRRIPIGHAVAGARVEIVDDHLAPVPMGVPGQIVIGGPFLASGYLNRPEQTADAFIFSNHLLQPDGTPLRIYLTGDLGRRRGDGQIEFLGRLDHQVKVRGFRIELEEIERIIESDATVKRAALKVVDSGSLAERLAAFVEVTPGFSEENLRRHLLSNLPQYKRPASLNVMEHLPIGTSGKVLRDQLPEPDSESLWSSITPPTSDLERFLEKRFSESLEQASVGVDANFFEWGGTSLQAALLSSALAKELDLPVPASLLFDLGDVRKIAAKLALLEPERLAERFGEASVTQARQNAETDRVDTLLAEFKPNSHGVPLFFVHPPGGIVACYRDLANALPSNQPLVAIRARGLHGDEPLPESMDEMATEYAQSIRARCPSGPYWLGGWSLGGVIAFEVAQKLAESGGKVAGVVLMDSALTDDEDSQSQEAGLEYGLELSLQELSELSDGEQLPFLYQHAERLGVMQEDAPAEVVEKMIEDLRRLFAKHLELCQSYQLQSLDAPLLLFRPIEIPGTADPRDDRGWGRWGSRVDVKIVSGHHHSMVKQPGAAEMAQAILQWMASVSPDKNH